MWTPRISLRDVIMFPGMAIKNSNTQKKGGNYPVIISEAFL